jgi:hypothetical protein
MYIVVLILFLLFSGASFAEEQTHGFSKSNMDTSVKPCDDLYQYANRELAQKQPHSSRSFWEFARAFGCTGSGDARTQMTIW